METPTETCTRMTIEEQYVTFLEDCVALRDATLFQGGDNREYRHEVISAMRDISASPPYADLAKARFQCPGTDLPQPDSTIDRIVRLMNRTPRKSA